MSVKTLIKRSQYYDSVSLMATSRDLARLPGVSDASVVMGTEANKALLKSAGLLTPEAESARPDDLIIAVRSEAATEAALDIALAEADLLLRRQATGDGGGEKGGFQPRTLRSAARSAPAANVAVISVAGRYAAGEAWEALRLGLHVLLFSDNVSLEDEIALKRYAADHGLLLIGPGAGTAILNGAALGFANAVPPGPVGIVSAAGTGLQEVSTLLAHQGAGVSQGIGTGGRDLRLEVGGIMMLAGLEALQTDPTTQVIVLVSKPPAVEVARTVLAQVVKSPKPTVVCFLGGDPAVVREIPNAYPVRTLQEAALLASGLATGRAGTGWLEAMLAEADHRLAEEALSLRTGLAEGQRYLRGLFSGGTLCYEAQVIWRDRLPERVLSNAPLDQANLLPDSTRSQGHSAVDLGEEEFTVGRPHPMIDNDLRIRRLLQEASDPEIAAIVLDVVLGYGAHPDPAAELGPAVTQAKGIARAGGRALPVVASITGTEGDPQRLSRQRAALESSGVTVCDSNAAAARLAAHIVCG